MGRAGVRLSQGPRVVGSAVSRLGSPCGGSAAAAAIRSLWLPAGLLSIKLRIVICPLTCAPGRIRTRDPLLRRQLLYPAELQAPIDDCAGSRSRRGHVHDTAVIKVKADAGPHGPLADGHGSRRDV